METCKDKLAELVQKVASCLEDEQDKKAFFDAIRDMEDDELELLLADYLLQIEEPQLYARLQQKAVVDREISRYYSKRGVNYAKLG